MYVSLCGRDWDGLDCYLLKQWHPVYDISIGIAAVFYPMKHWISAFYLLNGYNRRQNAIEPVLTFAVCEVAYAEDVVGIRVVVLFDVGSFLWGVLQLHGHFFQLFVQLFKQESISSCFFFLRGWNQWLVQRVYCDQKLNSLSLHKSQKKNRAFLFFSHSMSVQSHASILRQ